MRRYVAFLRGVFTGTVGMADLRRTFEAAGLADVKTVLASGNVLFSAEGKPPAALEKRIEAATKKELGRTFAPFVRRVDALETLLGEEPFARFRLPPDAKRIVSFLHRKPKEALRFPIVRERARILGIDGDTVYSAYVHQPGNPVFMALLAGTFGDEITTRTWETIEKVVAAANR